MERVVVVEVVDWEVTEALKLELFCCCTMATGTPLMVGKLVTAGETVELEAEAMWATINLVALSPSLSSAVITMFRKEWPAGI